MNFTNEIARFLTDAIGGICITCERTHQIVFADAFVERLYGSGLAGRNALEVLPWEERSLQLPLSREKAAEWEFVDQKRHTYWRLNHGLFDKDGETYKIAHMTNTTDYMLLSLDVAQYSAFAERLSTFQSAMLSQITSSCSALLPVIAQHFKSPRLVLLLGRKGYLEFTTFDSASHQCSQDRIPLEPSLQNLFEASSSSSKQPDDFPEPLRKRLLAHGGHPQSACHRLCAGNIAEQHYVLYLEIDKDTDREALQIDIISTITALCVENTLLRDEILYESEHDKLTGLYNKGKFLKRLAKEYPLLRSVGIFNIDVNYLKQTNDRLGHEAGDKLLVKAADSIRRVTSDNVHGYRLGGDEYLMIACNCSAEDVDKLKLRWELALEEVNQADDGIPCILAVGTAFGEAPYDFAGLMKLADERMYEDKRRKKKPGEEIR